MSEARRLREELAATKQYLEAMIEQHQTSGDEFATLNEELTAANEELQSTNEELESAKEELESANEELTTLNDELRSRNSDLDQLANDLTNVLEAVEIPIVIVDAERRVRRFTPDARPLLTLGPSDLGRPIDEIKLNIDVTDLDRRIADVMRQARQGEWEVQTASGRWFRMQIQPYTATERGLDGALLSFVDIDALKQTVRDAQSARDYARAIVESVQVPLLVVDDHHRVVSSNPAFERVPGAGAPLGVGDDLFARSGRVRDLEPLRRTVEDVLAGRSAPPPVEWVHRDLAGVGKRTFAVTVRRVAWPGGRTAALLAFEDLTEQRRLEEERTSRAVAERSSRTRDL
ncbi:MAG TPA: PAS domain-containing protein, partial [Anaeromyxobacter sp.]|nr:PAS domain-containing protein [Anaeromyxobacter sp.]